MNDQNLKWVLASGSPRRREILGNLGLKFEVALADTDEKSDTTDPVALVEELACRKAASVRDRLALEGRLDNDTVLIAADTVVISPDGVILGKPRDPEDAVRMLGILAGRTHRVASGVALIRGERTVSAHEITEVTFGALDEAQIRRYVATGEPLDKAGAYGIQSTAALWVEGICGDYFNVVGLPVCRLERLLRDGLGLSLWDSIRGQGGIS